MKNSEFVIVTTVQHFFFYQFQTVSLLFYAACCLVLIPEEQEHCHEKGLEVVVTIELCVIIYSNLPKRLSTRQIGRNDQSMKTHEGKEGMLKISLPASQLHHK